MQSFIHILHLEDDPADAELIQATLESADLMCQITRVQTRDEFSQALRQSRYDVIFADYQLPAYDGLSALRLSLERCPETPFIFISGTMGEDAAIEGLTEGATDYVLKQKLSRLVPAVTRALHEAENRNERQRAEAALRDSEARYRRITEAITDYMYTVRVVEGQAVETRHGPGCLAVTGYLAEEFAADPYLWLRMVVADDRPVVQEQARRVLAGEPAPAIEHRIVRKDGAVCWVCNTPVPRRDGQGVLRSYDGLIQDITKRKRTEEELTKHREHLEELVAELNLAEQERLAHLRFFECMDQINRAIQGTNDLEQMMSDVLDLMLSILECDRAFLLYPCDPDAPSWSIPMERTKPEYPGAGVLGTDIPMDPEVSEALRVVLESDSPVKFDPESKIPLPAKVAKRYGMKSFIAMSLHPVNSKPWEFGLHQCTYTRVWTPEEERLFQEVGRRLTDALTSLLTYRDLQESEAFLNNLVENIPDMIFVKDVDTLQFVRFNKAGEQLLGYSREELLGKTDYDFFPKEEADFFMARDRETLSQKGLVDVLEEIITTRNNDERILHTKKIPILDEHGTPQYLLGISEDITARKQSERDLQRSNDLLRAIIEAAPTAIIGLDLDGHVQMVWNPAAEKMLGWSAQDVMGRPLPSVPVESQEEFRRFREWIRSGKTLDGVEVRRQKRDGSPIDYSIYASPLHDIEGRIIGNVAVLVDITERKRTEEELTKHREHLEELVAERTAALEQEILERKHIEHALQKAKDAAEAANRAKSEFLANMSHELRTPLNAILGYAQLLKREKTLTAKQRDQLNTIHSSGEHLVTLISDLLDLSRIEAQKMDIELTTFHLPDLLRSILDASRLKAEERNLFVRYEEVSPLPAMVRGDDRKLRQVLLNLLTNAIKYTKHGGVTLRVKILDTGYSMLDTGNQHPASSIQHPVTRIRFEVEDTGIGIPDEQMQAIFEPFMRGDSRPTEGIGLGLAICRRLVELMGGRLSVDSEVGTGSTFTVELELTVVEAGETEENVPEHAIIGYHGERKRVLIVDDHITNLSMLVATLEPLGFAIETAESGEEALHKAGATPPDLILLDLLMPEMDGHETLRRLRRTEALEQVKVIGVSAAVADKSRVEAFAVACDGFLAKPVDIKELQETLNAQLQIEWIEEEAEATGTSLSTEVPPVDEGKPKKWPPQAVVEDLLDKVERGDFTRLENILDRLEGEDNEYKGICRTIRAYARRFDDDAIINYLSQHPTSCL